MKYSSLFIRSLMVLTPLSLFACASAVHKVDLPAGSDPQKQITEIETRLNGDRQKQYDQLSPKHFREAEFSLASARKKSEKGAPSDKVLADVGQAMAELQIVEANGAKGQVSLSSVLTARDAAKSAKAEVTLSKEFKSADVQLQGMGEDIEANEFHAESTKVSKLEGRYLDLELLAIKNSNLGKAHALIEMSEKAGAEKKTPETFNTAKVQYNSAARSIEANRHNPEAFGPSVEQSLKTAQKLDQVLKTVLTSKTSESVAIQIYDQKQQLAANQVSLQDADQKAKIAQSDAALLAQETDTKTRADRKDINALQSENQQYADQAALNQKIETIKSEFSPAEADVVRDGKKIIIRLKSMKFSTARFELTSSSLNTLQKVKEMIAAVPVSMVLVEGHTDSVGNAMKNQSLSQKRAETIRNYFVAEKAILADKVEAKGFGYEKPITTNKTAEGRATNRRVDVVIETTSTM